jgi:hypothetical protein
MSRVKQNRVIDSAIRSVTAITQSQCSLSETDEKIVAEALSRLQLLKKKKGKTNGQIQLEIVQVVLLLIKFFSKDSNDENQPPNL